MARRKYSDREKAEALAVYDSCGNLTETARITGIPDSTLSVWVQGTYGLNDDIPNLREFKKLDLASKLDTIAHQCAGLLPNKLPDSNVREIVGAMSQSIEKSQLLRGQPTSISAEAGDSKSALLRRISKISSKTGESPQEVEKSLQLELSDRSDEDYSAELDANVHPECWPSGNLLNSSVISEIQGEQ